MDETNPVEPMTYRLPAVDAGKVASEVLARWRRLDLLAPPASAESLTALELRVGSPPPPLLVDLYRVSNGTRPKYLRDDNLLCFWPLEDVLSELVSTGGFPAPDGGRRVCFVDWSLHAHRYAVHLGPRSRGQVTVEDGTSSYLVTPDLAGFFEAYVREDDRVMFGVGHAWPRLR